MILSHRVEKETTNKSSSSSKSFSHKAPLKDITNKCGSKKTWIPKRVLENCFAGKVNAKEWIYKSIDGKLVTDKRVTRRKYSLYRGSPRRPWGQHGWWTTERYPYRYGSTTTLVIVEITKGPLSLKNGENKFETIFKLSRKTFNYICSLVEGDLTAKPSTFAYKTGELLSPYDQVAVSLRRLCSGESLLNVGQLFGLNASAVSQVTWRFIEVMEERAIHHLRWPDSDGEIRSIKSKFEKMHGLPNCCGAIDTTHIMMCLPTVDSTNDVWIDNENNHSMILQAVVDPDMRFRDVVTGWPGSMDEPSVLRTSGFFELCEKGRRLNGERMRLSGGAEVGEYVVGDSGFPLLPWLITPYQGEDLTECEEEFNRQHYAARRVAKSALSRLKETWRMVRGEMWRPDRHRLPRILLVCCLLHNIVIDTGDSVAIMETVPRDHDDRYKQQYCNVMDDGACVMRDGLSRYLRDRRECLAL